MSPTPESELADPQQIIADLRSANAKLQRQFDRAAAERDEEEAQKAAMAEVLGVISASPGRLEPVFEAMLANAVRICGGSFGMLTLYEDGGFRGVAAHGDAASFPEHMSRIHRGVLPGTTLDGLAVTLRTVQLADVAAEPAYDPVRALNPAYARVRSHLCVPLIKENQLLGAILIYRDRVKQFDRKEVELVENFAAQAVIAMENARLITETREALEQQTATAEVLQVINSSPGDLSPVFQEIVDKAVKLCDAAEGGLRTFDGESFHLVALVGAESDVAGRIRQLGPIRSGPAGYTNLSPVASGWFKSPTSVRQTIIGTTLRPENGSIYAAFGPGSLWHCVKKE